MIAPPRKILIINIFGVGDVLFTTPLMANLKRHWPRVSVGYLCNERTRGLLENNPDINQVYVYARDEFSALYRRSKVQFLKKMKGLIGQIRAEGFDMSIDLSLNPQICFLTWLAGIKNRIGFDFRGRGFFLTRRLPLRGYETRHVVDYYLDILKELNVPVGERTLKVYPTPDDAEAVRRLCGRHGIGPNDRPVAILPGGGASWGKEARFKRWAPEKYAQLADKIIEKYSSKVILIGDQSESDLCREIAGKMRKRPVVVSGETSLGQLAVLLKTCRLAVVNDGGPLHLAVAMGTRTVSIFGPVDERVYGPYPRQDHLVVTKPIACRPCYRRFRMADCEHHNCLETIDTDEVFRKVEEAL